MHTSAWRIIYGLVFLITVVFCIRQVHEPDLWWQLRTGEYIIENGEVPQTDVFSLSYEGQPWVNVKWGFEVIQAYTVKWFGAEFLFLPQVFANLLIVFFLLKSFNLQRAETNFKPFANVLTLLLFLVGFSYRMNGRPEMISYLFTAIYIFLFQNVHHGKKAGMWLFIPLQLLWANLHEGFGVGIVLLIIFSGSYWLTYFNQKVKTEDQLKTGFLLTSIAFVAYLAVAIHPMGTTMLGYPYNIFTQLSANQFTSEILNAGNASYWQLPAFINLLFICISVFRLIKMGRTNGKFSLGKLLHSLPLFYLLIYVAFLYLSFKAYRNLPFFLIASAPLVAAQLAAWFAKTKEKIALAASGGIAVLFYIAIVSNVFYSAVLPSEKYGIGISPDRNSVGAANFIAEKNISGRPFSDYLGSAYLLWHLQPNFKTFVDLRDLDVFQADDMEIAISCVKYPQRKMQDGRTIWNVVDDLYQFDYAVVLNNPDFVNFHRLLFSNNTFEPVYADELNTVYVRKTDKNQELIMNFGISTGHEIWHDSGSIQASKNARVLSSFFNPFYAVQVDATNSEPTKRIAYYNYIGIAPN